MQQHGPSCLVGPRSAILRRRFGSRSRVRGNRIQTVQSNLPGTASESGIREDLVRRVRAQLAAGTYLTAEKWERALDNLAGRLAADS